MANIRNITQLLLHLNDDEIILNKENIVEYTGELPKSYNEPSSFTLLGKPFQNACIRAGYKCVEADINNDRYVISKINVATIENVNNNENIVISQNISLNNTNDCSEVIEEEKDIVKCNEEQKADLKIACFIQTRDYRNSEKYKEAIEVIKEGHVDILLFPEFTYIPLDNDEELKNLYERTNCLDSDQLDKLENEVLNISKKYGKAIMVCNKTRDGYFVSIWANPKANGEDTKTSHYIKFSRPILNDSAAIELKNNDFKRLLDDNYLISPISFKGYKIGMTICYDSLFRLYSACYGKIDIILNSTGGNVNLKKWKNNTRARSIENKVYTVTTMGMDKLPSSVRNTNKSMCFTMNGEEINYKNIIADHVYIYELPSTGSDLKSFDEQMEAIFTKDLTMGDYSFEIDKYKNFPNKYCNIYEDEKNKMFILRLENDNIFSTRKVMETLTSFKEISNYDYCIVINEWDNNIPQDIEKKLPSVLFTLSMELSVAIILKTPNKCVGIQMGSTRKNSILRIIINDNIAEIDTKFSKNKFKKNDKKRKNHVLLAKLIKEK